MGQVSRDGKLFEKSLCLFAGDILPTKNLGVQILMKKISLFCIAIALLALAVLPAAASAAESTSGANIRLVHPVAVAAIGNCVFVADNVDDNGGQSVIHGIDISGDTPVRKYVYSCTKPIVNLAEVNGNLYVMYADSVDVLTFSDTEVYLAKQYSDTSVSDYTYSTLTGAVTEIFASDKIYRKLSDDNVTTDSQTVGAKQLLHAAASDGNYVYFTKTINGVAELFRIKTVAYGTYLAFEYDEDDKLNVNGVDYGNTTAGAFGLKGLFNYRLNGEDMVAVFGNTSVRTLTEMAGEFSAETEIIASDSVTFLDGCYSASAGKIVMLNSEYKLDVYEYSNERAQFELQYYVGTDTIAQDIPTAAMTGFTLARSLGYPTNIAYKTSDEATSIPSILIDELPDGFIVLDYDGAEESDFYYVLIGDKFAWVEKTQGSTSAYDDPNLEIIDNNVSTDTAAYKAQFVSMNVVSIYELPLSTSDYTSFSQTVTEPQSCLVLQEFEETQSDGTTVEWYYVAYGENYDQYGFIPAANVGKFSITASSQTPSESEDAIGWRKINASLFEAVKIFAEESMDESMALYNEAGGELKLYSGTYVYLIRESGDACYISVQQADKTYTYGWVDARYVIGIHDITTNAVVGISILSVALLLTLVFVLVFMKKRRKNRVREDD